MKLFWHPPDRNRKISEATRMLTTMKRSNKTRKSPPTTKTMTKVISKMKKLLLLSALFLTGCGYAHSVKYKEINLCLQQSPRGECIEHKRVPMFACIYEKPIFWNDEIIGIYSTAHDANVDCAKQREGKNSNG